MLVVLWSLGIFVLFCLTGCKIVGTIIVPHGDVVLNPDEYKDIPPLYNMSKYLKTKYLEMGSFVRSMQHIDEVFLISPHGMALQKSFSFFMNTYGFGDAGSNEPGNYSTFTANVTIDYDYSKNLISEIEKKYLEIEGITGYSEDFPFPLGWGEVIPIYFFNNENKNVFDTKYNFFSLPRRRIDHPEQMVDEVLSLGGLLFEILEHGTKKNVLIVVSADLSHVHKNEYGPQPYPVRDKLAREYDEAIGSWIETGNEKYLLEDATKIADDALSCGYLSFILIQILRNYKKEEIESKLTCEPIAPTYYGMAMGYYLFNVS